jgi:hypothetical protein
MSARRLLLLAVFVGTFCPVARSEQTLTYADLLGRMTDVAHLAVLPEPGERCAQWSSWDRASKYAAAGGKYIAWGANADYDGHIRKEGKQMVMAEMEGPGCLWRVWSAAARKGHVKIYLDGKETPAVDLPFEQYFDGKTAPFNYPMLAYNCGQTVTIKPLGRTATVFNGQNLYMPISYQKSCKVMADPDWGGYYHFTYQTFPKGTQVPTFSAALVQENAAAVQKVNDFFQNHLGENPAGDREGQQAAVKAVSLEPGQTVRVADLTGPRAIVAVKIKATFGNRADQMAGLRRVALRMTWDGQAKPAVWCPLGDFFGTAPGENLYKSLMTGMTGDSYYAYWYMPFDKTATVELVNEDKVARQVGIVIVHAPLGRPFEGLGYFHAKWHRDTVALPPDRSPDWMMMQCQGRGRFCGVMLHVWSPRGGWWGEGDEKFFVDGEKFPSTFGTGSEDYFGYAWGHPALYHKPYHCQTMTENNAGHQSLLRWHVVDNVPFQKSFEGCIEKYDEPCPDARYACTACWYLSPDGVDPYDAVPVDQRDGYYVMLPIAGMEVVGRSGGTLRAQNMEHVKKGPWPTKEQLLWIGAAVGNKLDLRLPAPSAGSHRVGLTVTKAPGFATVQFYLDGKTVGEPVDLHHASGPTPGDVSLGTHELTAGDHTLSVEIVGVHSKATKGGIVGLDRLVCEPVKP